MKGAIVADTSGLLRAIAAGAHGEAQYPEFEAALLDASRIFVPALVLAEVDYFLSSTRKAMRHLVAEMGAAEGGRWLEFARRWLDGPRSKRYVFIAAQRSH